MLSVDDILWLDCETTGPDPREDRIVELAFVCRGAEVVHRFRPGVPIPEEASAVHGIRDADVADCPPFRDLAGDVFLTLSDAPALGGYNLKRFDLPLLEAELERAGLTPPVFSERPIVDLYQVESVLTPRTLGAVVTRYLGRDLEGAHSALADTAVLPAVLDAMGAQRPDVLTLDVRALAELCDTVGPYRTAVDEWFDRDGDEPVFRRGKHRGRTLASVRSTDRGYLRWMQRAEGISRAVKEFVDAR